MPELHHRDIPTGRGRHWRGRVVALAAVVGCAIVGTTLALTGTNAGASVPGTPSGYNLVFSDDFKGNSGTGVSTSDWQYDLGGGYGCNGCPGGWGTGEIENMTSSTANVYQDGNGNLAIKPIRDGSGAWTSGRIETKRTDFAAPAGGKLRVEGRIQLPNVTGAAAQGYWPAFWMLGAPFRGVYTNWPGIGEIDIMENVNGVNTVYGTLHCGTAPGGPCQENNGIGGNKPMGDPSLQSAFHTYAIEYDRSVSPEQIRWYVDGTQYHSVSANQVDATTWANATNHGFFVILNVAMGGGWPGGPSGSTTSGAPMLVDYVAVYTAGGGTQPTTKPPATTPPATTAPVTTPPNNGTGVSAFSQIEAENYANANGVQKDTCSDTGAGQYIGWLANGDWAAYSNVDFGSGGATQFKARVASGADGGVSGLVEVRLDSPTSTPLGSFAVGNTGGWQTWKTIPANISKVTGKHTVYVTFTSGQPADFVNLNWFTFGN